MFYDKLAPAMRWLDHQVGRPWNRVLLAVVFRGDLSRARDRERYFEVDAHGILRRGRFRGRSFAKVAATCSPGHSSVSQRARLP
jgi:hypothetical protein